jgi:hypothetical protein
LFTKEAALYWFLLLRHESLTFNFKERILSFQRRFSQSQREIFREKKKNQGLQKSPRPFTFASKQILLSVLTLQFFLKLPDP